MTIRTAVHLFYGPNPPGEREVEARALQARERARAGDGASAARERRDEALRAYPERGRKLAMLGLPVTPPAGFEDAFELRAQLQRTRLAEAERRIADALRPVDRAATPTARLARADAALASLRRPMNLAGPLPHGERRAPHSRDDTAREERAQLRSLIQNGLAHSREEAARIVAETVYEGGGKRACFT